MLYTDPIYGQFDISECILIDLIESIPMQRLHKVLQHGISDLIGVTVPITRFEHSLGVMLLTRKLGASIDEQIAALLHDVSHTAFSHVIDFVFLAHKRQEYHEEVKNDYINSTQIPEIFIKHGYYNWRSTLIETTYPILEQPLPDLCADRLDYFLRDVCNLGLATYDDCKDILNHLVLKDQKIVLDDLDIARWLAYTFIKIDTSSWAHIRGVGLYEVTARAIRTALERQIIDMGDLWGTDTWLWEKLNSSKDADIQYYLNLISPKTIFLWDDLNPTFRVATKLRSIDPKVVQKKISVNLSVLDSSFAKYRNGYLQGRRNEYPIRVIPPNG